MNTNRPTMTDISPYTSLLVAYFDTLRGLKVSNAVMVSLADMLAEVSDALSATVELEEDPLREFLTRTNERIRRVESMVEAVLSVEMGEPFPQDSQRTLPDPIEAEIELERAAREAEGRLDWKALEREVHP